jgi:cation:H+ antiporter
VRFDVPVLAGVSLLAGLLAWNGMLSRWDGALLVALLLLYLGALSVLGRRAGAEAAAGQAPPPRGPWTILWSIAGILAGLVLLVLGARLLVTGAVRIAASLGVNLLVVGLTLVAAGTSLPEAATSVVASLRGERDIAVGNVIGSNIFNILAVFGVAALIAPDGLPVAGSVLNFDLPVMIATAVICMPIFISGMIISRFEGGLFFLFYLAYTVLTVLIAFEATFAPRLAFLLAFAVMPATAALLFLMLLYRPPASWYILLDVLPADMHHAVHETWRYARRVIILVTGGAVLLAGAAMLLLPGPGIVTIALGLAILATEFVWARHFLARMREEARTAAARFLGGRE